MSEIAIQWIPIIVCLLLFVGVVIGEVQWLARKGWATSSRAVGYVLVTDLLGFGIGSFLVFVIMFVIFMMVMGPAGRGSNIPEWVYWVAVVVAVVLPSILFIILKRLFLLIFKMQGGKSAWVYSLASSLVIILIVLVPPPLIFYAIGTALSWK